jgi:hypothetical protein
MSTDTPTTDQLRALAEQADKAGHEARESRHAAQLAQAKVGQLREATVEAHASSPSKVKAATDSYREAQAAADEADMQAKGHERKGERVRAEVDQFLRANADALLEELRPAAEANLAERAELVARLVEVEARRVALADSVARYVSAGGHSVQGNVPADDALTAAMPALRDLAAGTRELASAMPTWKHRTAVEEHHRRQAEQAARRDSDRAAVGG